LVLLILFLALLPAAAQDLPRYEVRRAAGKIVIDGKLDDAAWKDAPTITFQFPWEQQTGGETKDRGAGSLG